MQDTHLSETTCRRGSRGVHPAPPPPSAVGQRLLPEPINSQILLPFPRENHLIQPSVCSVQFSSGQSLSRVRLFATPWTAAHQASLSITNSRSLSKLMSIESVMPSNHLILCRPFLLLPSIFPSIRVFSNEPVLCIRWSKYWRFSFNISPANEHSRLIFFRMDWLDLLALRGTIKSSPTP